MLSREEMGEGLVWMVVGEGWGGWMAGWLAGWFVGWLVGPGVVGDWVLVVAAFTTTCVSIQRR